MADLDASVPADASADLLRPVDIAMPPPLPDLVPRRPDNCGVDTIQTTETVRADLLLVQDRSGSMNDGVDGRRNPPGGQSKWDLISSAIEQVVSGTSSVNWGLMLFGVDRSCAAPARPDVPVGLGSGPAVSNVIANTTPSASTPTTATLASALAYFQTLNDGHPHYILLATDGLPTCKNGVSGGGGMAGASDDSLAAEEAVALAAAAGVHSFIVGVGSSTGAEATLNQMAENGLEPNTAPGEPAYYPVTNTQDLVNVLEHAALKITTCSYPLSAEPPVPDRVTITSAAGVIPRDPSHQDGWDYGSDGMSVAFYGPACAQLQNGVVTSVQATFACPGD